MMAEAVTEQVTCAKCGADVREGTVFCYKCGGRVAGEPASEENGTAPAIDDERAQAALDDLAEKMRSDDKPDVKEEKLAKAATERKKARVKQRASRDFVWEPSGDVPNGLLIAVFAAFVLAVFAVVVTVVWK